MCLPFRDPGTTAAAAAAAAAAPGGGDGGDGIVFVGAAAADGGTAFLLHHLRLCATSSPSVAHHASKHTGHLPCVQHYSFGQHDLRRKYGELL